MERLRAEETADGSIVNRVSCYLVKAEELTLQTGWRYKTAISAGRYGGFRQPGATGRLDFDWKIISVEQPNQRPEKHGCSFRHYYC